MNGPVTARLVDLGYAAGWALVRAVPEPVATRVFTLIADVAWWRRGRSVRQLESNLRRVLGPQADPPALRAASRAAMRSYLRYWQEVFRLPVLSRDRVLRDFVLEGEELLWAARDAGRGVIITLPHSGNWDVGGAWLAYRGARFTVVVERLRPESLFRRFVAFRRSLGMDLLPHDQPRLAAELAGRLRAGGIVGLVADRDLSASGIDVEFFGQTARMPAGPAALALATGAVLLPATLWQVDGGWRGRIGPAIEPAAGANRRARIAATTQAVAAAFEAGIAAHPTDWHMLQRLWTADLDPARRAPARPAEQVEAVRVRP